MTFKTDMKYDFSTCTINFALLKKLKIQKLFSVPFNSQFCSQAS